ncbi:hypothetical protein [Aulosira sp. FACHB-615]|uniref:hypothetical protein n=1 Tax=Aulosira sp. FACHB-615 TaxID=2692777 RepID=UPI001685DB28|nr:hypothetical protein [Aulosira sp. FACHB-615]MBD2486162.1 hypothetical protein [Aulosira sp. FACHB-615]
MAVATLREAEQSLNARKIKTFSPAWLVSELVMSAAEVAEPLPPTWLVSELVLSAAEVAEPLPSTTNDNTP